MSSKHTCENDIAELLQELQEGLHKGIKDGNKPIGMFSLISWQVGDDNFGTSKTACGTPKTILPNLIEALLSCEHFSTEDLLNTANRIIEGCINRYMYRNNTQH